MKNNYKQLSIDLIKNQIINATLVGASIIGSIAYLLSLTRFINTRFNQSAIIELVIIASLVTVSYFRRRISLGIKTITVVLMMFFLFLNDTISYGILSAARTIIILIPFFSLVYFSMKRTIAIYLFAVGCFLAVGYLHYMQVLHIPYDAHKYVLRMYPWIINAIHISLIAMAVLIITNKFNVSYTDLINDLKKSNKKISESEQSYREIFNASSDAIFIHGLDGSIIDANNSMLQMYGYQKEELASLSLNDLSEGIEPYSEPGIKFHLNKSLKEQSYLFDWRARKKDGQLFWVEVALKRATIIGEERILAVVRNIDEKKRTALELENYKNHLESIVKERTEELEASNEELRSINEELHSQRDELEVLLEELHNAQEQLVRTEKMASLGVLSAGIAHEINNPLNFIQGSILGIEQYFENKPKEELENIKPLIDGINTGVQRAANIVTSLNRFSRQDTSGISECDIHSIINNCLVILHNEFKNRITVELKFFNSPILLSGNEGRLHQAILNILNNAGQAIEDKGTIRIQTDLKDHHLELIIADTGQGIPTEIIHKITDPFFTTKSPGKGTGLGLSITYTIIEEHKGNITFKSIPGKGTSVKITLPANG